MGTAAKKIDLTIPCSSEYIGVIRLAVSGIATRMNFSVEDIDDIKLAVSEACTNSVQYAYEAPEKERISVTCNIHQQKLEILILDTGRGFDSNHKKDKHIDSLESDELPSNLGLGFTFIKSMMDETTITSNIGKGTTVKIAKYLPK